jgi:protein gp37
MARTKIDYCDETLNWYTGCRRGCPYCYARRMAHRLNHVPCTVYWRVGILTSTASDDDGDPFAPAVHLDVRAREYNRLLKGKPRRIFLGSMGDICFEGRAITYDTGPDGIKLMPRDEWWDSEKLQIDVSNWCSILAARGHEFLVLTKRPDLLVTSANWPTGARIGVSVTGMADRHRLAELVRMRGLLGWPNDPDGPALWASVEPLVDPDFDPFCLSRLDWVVVGLQTGPGAPAKWTEERKKLEDAARRIARWCKANGVKVFVKGNVGWKDGPQQHPGDWF